MNLPWSLELPWSPEGWLASFGVLLALVALLQARAARKRADAARSVLYNSRPAHTLRSSDVINSVAVKAPQADPDQLRYRVGQLEYELGRLRSQLEQRAADVPLHKSDPAASEERQDRADAASFSAAPERPTAPVGRAVEFDGEVLRPSRSLSAPGLLSVDVSPAGAASLFLNDMVQLDHIAFERWSTLFEFRGGGPYARYRTVSPARIAWDEAAERGRLVARGTAEVVG